MIETMQYEEFEAIVVPADLPDGKVEYRIVDTRTECARQWMDLAGHTPHKVIIMRPVPEANP